MSPTVPQGQPGYWCAVAGIIVARAGVAVEHGMTDMKLEVDIIAVADVDRARGLYQQIGWRTV
jgi:hypothetical protein